MKIDNLVLFLQSSAVSYSVLGR